MFGRRNPAAAAIEPEQCIRVSFTLPVRRKAGEIYAILDVLDYLQQQQNRKLGVDGFTYSNLHEPVFNGYWWDKNDGWIDDFIVLFIVDYLPPSVERRFSLDEELAHLKQVIARSYERHGSEQKEVWVVSHNIFRQT